MTGPLPDPNVDAVYRAAGEGSVDGMPGHEDATSAAVAAAADLPSAEGAKLDGADKFGLVFSVLVCLGTPVVGFALIAREHPWGWLLDLAGLPLWLLVRWLFFKVRGSETGQVTVDDQGVVRVRSGQSAIRRLQRLFDVGPVRWFAQVWLVGIVFTVVPLGVLVGLCLLLDSPAPAVVFLTGIGWALLDLARFAIRHWLWRRSTRLRLLDASAMLPALALYARHHGWREAVSGVPADRLAATLAAHPQERVVVDLYSATTRAMTRAVVG